jgi:essential nuclear protein 1
MSRSQQLEEEVREQREERKKRRGLDLIGSGFGGTNVGRKRGAFDDGVDSDDDEDVQEEEQSRGGSDEEVWVRQDAQGYVSAFVDFDVEESGGDDANHPPSSLSGLSKEDRALVAAMMEPSTQRQSLADLILEKIHEKEQQQHLEFSSRQRPQEDAVDLPPKVVHVYTEIGKVLSRYTSGKLPKAFKVIPSLSNWQDVLWLTRPDLWTPQACYAATRIFASNLNPKMAQRFYELVLLDSVRSDIHGNKKLNYHYYMALKKSVYKPSAFFKGIILPLARPDAECTLREAVIVASVLQRVSIPVHHAAVAIYKLATSPAPSTDGSSASAMYSGPVCIFLRALLNKKYSLPAPVIGSVVSYFCSFSKRSDSSASTLPVLWHQALLVFVQRYRDEIRTSESAVRGIRDLLRAQHHPKLTPEIRRELFGSRQAWEDEQRHLQLQRKIPRERQTSDGLEDNADLPMEL